MDEASKKGNPGLSIDRAAFLLLRVKKAFKRKRQQRKEKQAAQNATAALVAQARAARKNSTPPLFRSRTLPAIVVPGISIIHTQIDPNRLSTGDCGANTSQPFANKFMLHPRSSRGSLISDDSSLEYRRKSSSSTHSGPPNINYYSSSGANNNNSEPYIYACDDFERHADGTVVLRIPAPHVVAARAYRVSGSSSTSSGSTVQYSSQQQQVTNVGSSGGSTTALYRLARLLNQTTKGTGNSSPPLNDDAPRRLSWERRDNSSNRVPRSASIDSMVESVWSTPARKSLDVPRNTSFHGCNISNQNFGSLSGSRRESILSPATGRRTKHNRGITEITLPDIITRTPEQIKTNLNRPTSVPLTSKQNCGVLQNIQKFQHLEIESNFTKVTKCQDTTMEFLAPQPPHQNGRLLHYQQQSQTHKMTKKQLKMAQAQLDKLTQVNIHLHALFSAVEHGHLDKAKTILESTDVDVNSLNSDGLSPLDVAVLSNNRSMTKMLLQHGAIEGNQFKTPASLGNHLSGLFHDAETRVQDLSSIEDVHASSYNTRASFSLIMGSSGPAVTSCAGTEVDKQLGLWERRVKGLRRMLLGWDQARPPDKPYALTVDVASTNAISVYILEPQDGSITTKFKVQWSSRADFNNIVGEREIFEWTTTQGIMGATIRINDLTQGRRYFIRGCCGNVKGWGSYRISIPASVVPSSWRGMDNREQRFAGRQRILDDLFAAVRLARPEDASDIAIDTPALQRRNPKKKTTIKQLFSAASKFQKNLRRGIHLACILYCEDKILVTNEDFIPIIEIDETYPSSLHADYHWLMKVACTWDDVKSLRNDMERNSTSAIHFRTKLLSAACQMQSALCISDLGQLYHKPLRDSHGTVVLSCINFIKNPKSISGLNSRWVPFNKIQKKVIALHEDNNINEILVSSITEQISYHQTSSIKLSRGLYLGYLKMQSSVDQIQVVVPTKTPNVLPHSKIRDNPHISAEEWEVVKGQKSTGSLEFRPKLDGRTELQDMFLEALTAATHQLFTYMNVSAEEAIQHRLYDIEVIELSPDVSFLIVCPPVESSCAVPGQREILLQRGDLLSLSVQAFEMIHLRTYQNIIIQKYSRLSCILELDTAQANHSHREAFSTIELQVAKERLAKLQELTANLNTVWKGVRWLMDVISFARDRSCNPGLTMKEILEFNCIKQCFNNEINKSPNTSQQLLQLPTNRDGKLLKSSPGRGSWPGPNANIYLSSNSFLDAEHSKSEQNLGCSAISSRYLSATSATTYSSRKNSADSNCSQSGNIYYSAGESTEHIPSRLPPSRSEDTLVLNKKHNSAVHRKRITVNSAKSSPHLSVKSNYQATTESLQSLSSDSESSSFPIMTSTPDKNLKTRTNYQTIINDNKQTASCSSTCNEKNLQQNLYLKPTLTALQNEIKLFKEPLQIKELPSSPKRSTSQIRSRKNSTKQSSDEEELTMGLGNTTTSNNNQPLPGIIQVYAAYETGLTSGTSLKLHVTPKTSAREVIDLVIKQLNMAVVLKGKDGPIYTADKLQNFCLVAVIGARERCLRDDFKPLQLQNPWKKGRLYVRQKHDLLAAIEHSNRDTHLI